MSLLISVVNNKGTITADNISVSGGVNARDWMGVENNFLSDGYIEFGDGNNMVVQEDSPAGLSVVVSPGVAYVKQSSFSSIGTDQKLWEVVSNAAATVTIAANGSGSTRYDWVGIKVDSGATSDDTGSNLAAFTVVQGTAGAGVPSLVSDFTPNGLVTVTASASSITDADITDVRKPTGFVTGGWGDAPHTWSYASTVTVSSSTAVEFTATVTGTDAANLYRAGMKFRCFQATGGVKYFIITKVDSATNTTITLFGGTDYTLENEAIFSPMISTERFPKGFPLDPDKWSVELVSTSSVSQTTPTQNVWYNLGGLSLDIPTGIWDVRYKIALQINTGNLNSGNAYATLSTGSASESNNQNTCVINTIATGSATTQMVVKTTVDSRIDQLNLSTADTYYLNALTDRSDTSAIFFRGDNIATIVRAVSTYLYV